MQEDYKKIFWEKFDSEFEIEYLLVLSGMTSDFFKHKIKNSTFQVNQINSNKIAAINYLQISSKILQDKNLENDIKIINGGIYSINLNNVICNSIEYFEMFESLDTVYKSRYNNYTLNLNIQFSFLLGNYIRFYSENKFTVADDKKRLYILSNIIENFTHRDDSIKIKILNGIENSFLEFQNIELSNRLQKNINLINNIR